MIEIVYAGAGLSGKQTSLLNWITLAGHQYPKPFYPQWLLAPIRFPYRWRGATVELAISVSQVRGARAGYDPTGEPQIVYEIDLLVAAHGIIFVVDSHPHRQIVAEGAWSRLRRDLSIRSVDVDDKLVVFQANKRDLPEAVPMSQIRSTFHTKRCAYVESIATRGVGVLETTDELLRLITESS